MNVTELARSLNMTEDQLWKLLNQSVGLNRTGAGGTGRPGLMQQNNGEIPVMNRRRIGGGGLDTSVPQYLGGKMYDPREQWGSGPYAGRTMGFSDLPFGGFHMTGEQIAKAGPRYNPRNYYDAEDAGQSPMAYSQGGGGGDIATAASAIKRLRETLKGYMDYSSGSGRKKGTDTSYTEPGLVDTAGMSNKEV